MSTGRSTRRVLGWVLERVLNEWWMSIGWVLRSTDEVQATLVLRRSVWSNLVVLWVLMSPVLSPVLFPVLKPVLLFHKGRDSWNVISMQY